MTAYKSAEVWKNTIYRRRKMMQIVAPIWKIKVGEPAEIIRERRWGEQRVNTQCSRKIGHLLSTKLESENTDSLRRSERIRGWWSGAARLENLVLRVGLAGGLYLSTTDGVKCSVLKNRWTSKLIKPGSWVKRSTPRMSKNASPNQEKL